MELIWTIALLLGTVAGKEICYQRLGCFTDDKPWAGIMQRPLYLLPFSPETINTRFYLYTNENQNNYQEIVASNLETIETSNFKKERKTRFVIHGYMDKGEGAWLKTICKNLFKVEEVNCICVDWRNGALTKYTQASQNIRVVGAEIAYLLEVLQNEYGYSPANVHLIGHSLGAHASGEAGRRLNGQIGRITGMDPAEPCFEGTPEEVRLDPSDAQFVDVIHTDAAPFIVTSGFGTSQVVGHLDFFPNGGEHMPGCKKNANSQTANAKGILEGAINLVACNHLRSYKYYADSILHPDGFTGYPCASYKDFSENKCFPCPAGGCPQMGHYADRFPGAKNAIGQVFYLNTGKSSSFALWRYKISIVLSGAEVTGNVKVSMDGDKGNSKQFDIFKGNLQPGYIHSNEIDSNINVGAIKKIKFLWSNNGISPALSKVGASMITVETSDGQTFSFCSKETVSEDVPLTLNAC